MELISIGFLLGVIFSMIVFGGGVVYGYYYGDLGDDELGHNIDTFSRPGDSDNGGVKTARPDRQDQEKD